MGGWAPSTRTGRWPGFDGVVAADGAAGKCGLLNAGRKRWRAWASWKLDRTSAWQRCKFTSGAASVTRYGTDQKVETVARATFATIAGPPTAAREGGWYTSGTHEVVSGDADVHTAGGRLVADTPSDWDAYMRAHHIFPNDAGISVKEAVELRPQLSTFRCELKATITNADQFEEFQDPCSRVEVAAQDGYGGLAFRSLDTRLCRIVVGYGADSEFTSIVVNPGAVVAAMGPDRWRCKTVGTVGENCTDNGLFEMIDAGVIEKAGRSAAVVESLGADPEDTGAVYDLRNERVEPNTAEASDIRTGGTVIMFVAVSLIVLAVIAICIGMVIKKQTKKRGADPEET
jgi:hypothetical protein